MEHNLEKIFREKIGAAERNPVRWNKEQAWHVVEMSLVKRRKSTPYFYAAASIALIALATGAPQMKSIISTAEFTEARPVEKVNEVTIPPKEIKCKPDGKKPVQPLKRKTRTHVPLITQDKSASMDSTNNVNSDAALSDATPFTRQETKEVTIVLTVEPVIGVILPEDQKPSEVTVRKARFRFFRSPEKNTDEPFHQDMKTLFARIN